MKEGGQENDEKYKKLAAYLKIQLEYQKGQQQRANQRVQAQLNNMNNQDMNQHIVRAQQQQTLPVVQNAPQTAIMTQLQKDLLKAQIFAFRNHIIKRESVPDMLMNAIRGINTAHNLQEYERLYNQSQLQQVQQSQPQPQQVQSQQLQQPVPLQQSKLSVPSQQSSTILPIQTQPTQMTAQLNRRLQNQPTPNLQMNAALANMKNFQQQQQQQFANNVQKRPMQQQPPQSTEVLNYPRTLDLKTLVAERNRRVETERAALLSELNSL